MSYLVKTISKEEQLDECTLFKVDCFNWGGDYRPETYGRLGFIPGDGFYLKMTCKESNPTRVYEHVNDPVHLDSAMEAFFQFYPNDPNPSPYFNFEFNANGALHVKYGVSRKNRIAFPLDLIHSCRCKSKIYEDHWTCELHIPLNLIEYIFHKKEFKVGDSFNCNFYKIKESKGLTHFGSYAPITSDQPDFHLPNFFTKATVID